MVKVRVMIKIVSLSVIINDTFFLSLSTLLSLTAGTLVDS